jgi:hypothetical protein
VNSSLLSLKFPAKNNSSGGISPLDLSWVIEMFRHGLQDQQSGDETGDDAQHVRSLGAVLRSAREERALTIREAAVQVHIPAQYLTMLEANDYSGIADELYLLPFVRNYADFLGLDPATLQARFLRRVQPVERVVGPELELTQEPAMRRSGWVTTAAVMLFVALALYLVGLK